MSRYSVVRVIPSGYQRRKPGRPKARDESPFHLPSPGYEALALLREIDPTNPAHLEATRAWIDVTARHRAILYHLTARDPVGRRLVDTMLRFRADVRVAFDRLVAKSQP